VVALGTGGAIALAAPSGAGERPRATATLVDASNQVLGSVVFLGHGSHATKVRVSLDLPATAPGLGDFHGLHVHAAGVCQGPFTSAGGHFDDGSHVHGRHLGDLPSVYVGTDGTASAEIAIDRFDVSELVGRSVILHAGRDNFNNVPTGAAADHQHQARGSRA